MSVRAWFAASMFAAATSLGACIDDFAPEVGPLAIPACSNLDSDPGRDISFQEDLAPSLVGCGRCHTPGGATPIGIVVGGLDLSSLETLRRGGVQSMTEIIVAGAPCASMLVRKIGEAPPFGSRMPLDAPPLSASVQQQFADWIAEGAEGE